MDPALTAAASPARRRLAIVWVAVAALFGALLAAAQATQSGLDDPDPALQRPGFLDLGPLPQPAPLLSESVTRPGQRTVTFFVRREGLTRLCRALGNGDLAERADLVIVVAGSGRCDDVTTVEDPTMGLATAFGLRRPRSGGAPVGYAVIDRRGQIRYRTLDPTVAAELGEVETIVRATP